MAAAAAEQRHASAGLGAFGKHTGFILSPALQALTVNLLTTTCNRITAAEFFIGKTRYHYLVVYAPSKTHERSEKARVAISSTISY